MTTISVGAAARAFDLAADAGLRRTRSVEQLITHLDTVDATTIADLLAARPDLAQSTVYRILGHLERAGAVIRIPAGDRDAFALATPRRHRWFRRHEGTTTLEELYHDDPDADECDDIVSILTVETVRADPNTQQAATR